MARFQLVFRTADRDVSEFRDNSESGEPRLNGVLLADGLVFAHSGSEWLATRDDYAAPWQRFVCTPFSPATDPVLRPVEQR